MNVNEHESAVKRFAVNERERTSTGSAAEWRPTLLGKFYARDHQMRHRVIPTVGQLIERQPE